MWWDLMGFDGIWGLGVFGDLVFKQELFDPLPDQLGGSGLKHTQLAASCLDIEVVHAPMCRHNEPRGDATVNAFQVPCQPYMLRGAGRKVVLRAQLYLASGGEWVGSYMEVEGLELWVGSYMEVEGLELARETFGGEGSVWWLELKGNKSKNGTTLGGEIKRNEGEEEIGCSTMWSGP